MQYPDDAPWFTLDQSGLKCKVVDVYDGDTVTIMFPFREGFSKDKCRLTGIDTPEIRTRNKEEKERGYQARDWLRDQILDKEITANFSGRGKYGRLLVEIYLDESKPSINQQLITLGHAKPYSV